MVECSAKKYRADSKKGSPEWQQLDATILLAADIVDDGSELLSEDSVKRGVKTDEVADDKTELEIAGAASSQTLRNIVPKPVPTESIVL
jgi:hypothetical protein